jgi:cell division protein FtsL
MVVFNFESYIPNISTGSKGEKYLYGALITAPFFAVFLILFPEKKLKQLSYSEEKIEKGNKIVLIGTITAVLSLPIYLILKWQ